MRVKVYVLYFQGFLWLCDNVAQAQWMSLTVPGRNAANNEEDFKTFGFSIGT